MPFFDPIRIGAAGAADTAYTIDRSLRFSGADQTRLSYTPASGGEKKRFTFSFWIKRGSIDRRMIFGAYNSGASTAVIEFQDDHKLHFYDYVSGYRTSLRPAQVFRDPSAWYHIVVIYNSTLSTESDRAKIYINGSRVTDFDNATYPSQNQEALINDHTIAHAIGTEGSLQRLHFDGYMAEFYFLDGIEYDASYFGETNATTGQWIPKEYTGSFGNNGYYLKFADNSSTSALGTDSSGNGNNLTPTNFSVSAGSGNDSLEDTPTNNFCTLNPLFNDNGRAEPNFSNANLDINNTGGGDMLTHGTFAVKSGKYYFEAVGSGVGFSFGSGTHFIGIQQEQPSNSVAEGLYRSDGRVYDSSASASDVGVSYSSGDVIGVAFDADTGKVWFAKNNTYVSSGDPANGNNPAFTWSTTNHITPALAFDNASDGKSWVINFGQRAFTYTPPTGFEKLNSANLPDPTILDPTKHFNTILYTGDDSDDRDITGVGFQPDFLWIKNREGPDWNNLTNAVAGANRQMYSNETDGESVDNSNGHVNSYLADGFNVSALNSGNVNENNEDYVAWNWNAGDTDSKTYAVTVVSDSGNKYRFDGFGTSAVTLDLAEGGTYVFDWSDSSAQSHPIRFSTTSDGTHGGGSEYTTGVTKDDSAYKTTITIAASAPTLYYYCQNHSGMGGAINTNSTLGSSNFDGTIQSVVKASPTAGFSIINYTGTGSTATVGHGLGVAPEVIILKDRNAAGAWKVLHKEAVSGSYEYFKNVLYLNSSGTFAGTGNSYPWGNTEPTSSVFSLGNIGSESNRSGSISSRNYVAYCFSGVSSYSKFGSYIGNNNADGTFVFLGFRPAWLMIKNIEASSTSWYILDNKRDPDNPAQQYLSADNGSAEATYIFYDFLSNGFKLRNTGSAQNPSGQKVIYLAFAESPFKNARAR